MPYIERNNQNQIVALHATAQFADQEFLNPEAAEVQAFLVLDPSTGSTDDGLGGIKGVLSASDLDSIRILDDLIFLLIKQNTIRLTDLPTAAQKKLLSRQKLRSQINDLPELLPEEDPLL